MPRYVKDIFRVIPGAADIGAQSNIVTVKAHEDDRTLEANIDTDADGAWTFTYVPEGSVGAGWTLDPGPIYWEGTYAGFTRRGSSLAGPLMGPNSILEMHYGWMAFGNGVILDALAGNFAVTLDGVGMDCDIAAGKYMLDGIQITNPSARELTVTAADGTHPRIDRVILEMTRTEGNAFGKTVLKMKNGTAAASPTAPTLTNNATTIQKSLAQVRTNAGATTPTSVTDERDYTVTESERNPVIETVARSNAGAAALSTTEATLTDLSHTPTLVDGVRYDILIEAEIHVDGAVNVAQMAPFIGDVTAIATFQDAPVQAGVVLLSNAHVLDVLGTGAAVTIGVRAKKNGAGTVNWYSGVSRMIAVPRS